MCFVAPLVGAWIEINLSKNLIRTHKTSLLSWERGLKFVHRKIVYQAVDVAPLVGAWIEII